MRKADYLALAEELERKAERLSGNDREQMLEVARKWRVLADQQHLFSGGRKPPANDEP